MSRDDGILYPGSSSASFTSPKATEIANRKAVQAKQRDHTRTKLEPQVQELMDLIDGYKKSILADLSHQVIGLDAKEERVIAELRAIQLNLQFVDSFRLSVSNLMRRK